MNTPKTINGFLNNAYQCRQRTILTHSHLHTLVFGRVCDMLFFLFLVLSCKREAVAAEQSQTNAISTGGRLVFCCLFNHLVVLLTPIQSVNAYSHTHMHMHTQTHTRLNVFGVVNATGKKSR